METLNHADFENVPIVFTKEKTANLNFDYTAYYPYGTSGRLIKLNEESGKSTINRRKQLFNSLRKTFKMDVLLELRDFGRELLNSINYYNIREGEVIVNPFVCDESGFSSLGAIKRNSKSDSKKKAELKYTTVGFTFVRLGLFGFLEALVVKVKVSGYHKDDGVQYNEEELKISRSWVKEISINFYPIVSAELFSKESESYVLDNRQIKGIDVFELAIAKIRECSLRYNTLPGICPSLEMLNIDRDTLTSRIKSNDGTGVSADFIIKRELISAKTIYDRFTEAGDYCWIQEKLSDNDVEFIRHKSRITNGSMNNPDFIVKYIIQNDLHSELRRERLSEVNGFYIRGTDMKKLSDESTSESDKSDEDYDLDKPVDESLREVPLYQPVGEIK